MNNVNTGISPKVSDFSEEILTIFNKCYNDFKNTYGEKHIEHIKLKRRIYIIHVLLHQLIHKIDEN